MKEEAGLGDLGSKMDKIFNNPYYNRISGSYLSTDFTGTEQPETMGSAGHPLYLPSTDITIPNIEKTSRIKILEYKKNPIYIELSDGTKAHFTYDEFRKIQGKPAIGKLMTIIFQRHPEDRGQEHSKIERAIVLDG
jgi:hypothetical protein